MKNNGKNIKRALSELLATQTRAVKNLSRVLGADFNKAIEMLSHINGKIVVSGTGKSGHVGAKIAATMTSLGMPAVFIHPGEAMHGDLGLIGKDDALIAISYSGGTKEVLRLVQHLKRHKLPVISITGKAQSALAKMSSVPLVFHIDREGSPFGLAPMASTTATLVIGDLLATALSLKAGFTERDFADVHPGGSLGLQLTKVVETMNTGRAVPCVPADASLTRALKEITRTKLGVTGVTDSHGRLAGVVSDGDVRRFLLTGRYTNGSLARDAMTRKPKTISADDSLQNALAKMEEYKITSLFVVDRGTRPVGIIHLHDIVERQLS